MNIENFLANLRKVKKSGSGWTAQCPAHDDRHNSLSIGIGKDGRILFKCHAGCHTEEILKALGITWSDLFPESQKRDRPGITVEELAFAKGLPAEFLESLGVEDCGNGLRITYYLEDGSLAPRQRKRWALSAKQGSCWEKGDGKPVLYGLWKVAEAKQDGRLFFVEGESDSWTLWWHQYPALGIPGADMAQKIESKHVSGIAKIYIVKEPDQGGETFVKGIRKRLGEVGYKGILFVIEMKGAKDPNELHQRSANFKEAFERLIHEAKPLSLVESDVAVDYGPLIPELPKPADKTVVELMQEAVAQGGNFAILAPQGSGKSYANARIAVSELKKGRSVIILSRSHDELNQLGRTVKVLLRQEGLPEYHLFHLKGVQRDNEEKTVKRHKIPDVRPIIVIAPHAYLRFKGETPYHHTLADMIFKGQFGNLPLVLIDEFVSYLEEVFLSKPLGSRNSLKKIFSEELWIRNRMCPLFMHSGNCLNCIGNMFLQPRRGNGGMLEYQPISQRHKEDHLKNEKVEIDHLIKWDCGDDDNTMRVYPITQSKDFRERQWSTGKKDDLPLPVSLKTWLEDVVTRLIQPNIVFFFPYDSESRNNIGRPLTEEKIRARQTGRRIVPPRNVCGVPILQGWDLAVLMKMKGLAQIGFTGPSASEADRYVLQQALGEIRYYLAQFPYVQFRNLLILAVEKDLLFEDRETQSLIKSWTEVTKVLSFLPTYYEAGIAEQAISEKVKTMYYDGAQKIQHAPIEGTSIGFDLCVTCTHGPLGQGVDLGQFKIAMISTNCERPKCLFVGRPVTKTNKEYIAEDVAEKSRQAALRILRLTENEEPTAQRIFLFYGRYALEVSHSVEKELAKVGHTVKVVNAQNSVRYAQEYSLKWLEGADLSALESIGASKYEEETMMGEAKRAVLEYLEEHPQAGWREIVGDIRVIRDMPALYKRQIKMWIQKEIAGSKQQEKIKQVVERIQEYLKQNPQANWPEIRRKFNLDRKISEVKDIVKQILNL